MSTTTDKKATRAHLMRAAIAGKLWVKCNYHYTDDYAFDNANGFGKDDEFRQVYFVPEHSSPLSNVVDAMYMEGRTHQQVEPFAEALGIERQAHADKHDAIARGRPKMRAWDFRCKSGHCWGTLKSGRFSVHSNLSYSYEIR